MGALAGSGCRVWCRQTAPRAHKQQLSKEQKGERQQKAASRLAVLPPHLHWSWRMPSAASRACRMALCAPVSP